MARPLKNNAEYFSHDADMRNDLRVKAVRNKIGLDGYAIWCMMLEVLTDSDDFRLKWDDTATELISADFGITTQYLRKTVQYLSKINLIQIDTKSGYITCETLVKRFDGLLSKRKRSRSGVMDVHNSPYEGLSTSKTHKVKESKVNKKEQKTGYAKAPVFVPPKFEEVRDYFHREKLYDGGNPIDFFKTTLTENWQSEAIKYNELCKTK